MHIGVLTGGGDVPGLNAAIKSVYNAAKDPATGKGSNRYVRYVDRSPSR